MRASRCSQIQITNLILLKTTRQIKILCSRNKIKPLNLVIKILISSSSLQISLVSSKIINSKTKLGSNSTVRLKIINLISKSVVKISLNFKLVVKISKILQNKSTKINLIRLKIRIIKHNKIKVAFQSFNLKPLSVNRTPLQHLNLRLRNQVRSVGDQHLVNKTNPIKTQTKMQTSSSLLRTTSSPQSRLNKPRTNLSLSPPRTNSPHSPPRTNSPHSPPRINLARRPPQTNSPQSPFNSVLKISQHPKLRQSLLKLPK